MSTKAKVKTLDEHCNKPAGSFEQFVQKKQGFMKGLDAERKERTKASRKAAACELSWAA